MDLEYFRRTFRLIEGAEKPMYQQLYEYFKRLIIAGILKEGDNLIPEITICNELKVSRSTVRKAMDRLMEDGLISRHRGKGSRVMNPQLRRPVNYLYNFTENMRNLNATPSSIVLLSEVVTEAPEHVQKELEILDPNTSFFHLYRIRLANGKPMLLENTYIPYYLCPGIEVHDFGTESLYSVLSKEYMLNLHHATETIDAVLMDEEVRNILQCDVLVPAFKIKRIAHLDTGMSYEYTSSYTRADQCTFELELYKKASGNTLPVEVNRTAIVE